MKTFSLLTRKIPYAVLGGLLLQTAILHAQVDCAHTSTGNIPINDLGAGYYLGYQGGLYPDGSNDMPNGHAKSGIFFANNIKPLDKNGNVDLDSGKVVFMAFGASTMGNTFNYFKTMVNNTPDIYNPCLALVNGCIGGKGLETMIPPGHHWYWEYLADTLMQANDISAEQVQIGWIKSASKDDTINIFPLQADSIYSKYIRAINELKKNFPNLKILYINSHAYGGYAGDMSDNADIAGEPAAYFGGFSVKWVIEDQLNGSSDLKYLGKYAKSPWLSWGPYYWADGINPRETDGLTWECDEFDPEGGGFHLSDSGKMKEAQMMIDLLVNSNAASKWFLNGPTWSSCDPDMRHISTDPDVYDFYTDELSVFPSPNHGDFHVAFRNVSPENVQLKIMDMQGRLIYSRIYDAQAGTVDLAVPLQDPVPGMYMIAVFRGADLLTRRILIQ
ncbi:MAG: T9SS type A sorting domain-containing protein [Chitinophagales bacterium]